MIKQFYRFVVLMIISCAFITANKAYGFEIGGIEYRVISEEDHTAMVYFMVDNSYQGSVEIPETVVHDGISYTVTTIDNAAFNNCIGLTSVTIPNSVTTIKRNAFAVTGLASVTIPKSVTSIEYGVFCFCENLDRIDVEEGNEAYCSIDGVLFTKSCDTVLQCPGAYSGAYTIPNSVNIIEDFAFAGCGSLTSVTIPSSVTSIGRRAFSKCYGLTSVTIPNSVTTIKDSAFDHSGLTSVTIPNSVTSIGSYVFFECGNLVEINVEEGNEVYCSIDGVLFNKSCDTVLQCPDGYSGVYTIPGSVTTIGELAFSGCIYLTSVTIPNSVTSIGLSAFSECGNLVEINVEEGNEVYCSIDGVLFNKSCDTVLQCPDGYSGVYTIPGSVTTIGELAFSGCINLTSVTIPNSVTDIVRNAFDGCTGLKTITIGSYVTAIGSWTFHDCSSLEAIYCKIENPFYCYPDFSSDNYNNAVLYIPTGTLNAYKEVEPWKNFQHIEEIDFVGVSDVEVADEDMPFEVYSLSGVRLYDGTDLSGLRDILPVGVYIIRYKNGSARKIVI